MEKETTHYLESEDAYYEKHLVDVDGQGGCVDDRLRVDKGPRQGIKLLGGSVEIADMIMIAMHQEGMNTKLPEMTARGEKFDVVNVVMDVYQTPKAIELGLKPGVHNDDNHGEETDPEALAVRIPGCGHDKVRANVLLREFGLVLSEEDANLVYRFTKVGAPKETYTGHHVPGAKALENYHIGKTLDTNAVFDEAAAFNHDIWALIEIAEELQTTVRKLGGRYAQVATHLTRENIAIWSSRLYRGTLTDLGGPADSVIDLGK